MLANIDEVRTEEVVRVLGIILLIWKDDPQDEEEISEYRFIVGTMEQPRKKTITYLPYGIYHHKPVSSHGKKAYEIKFLSDVQIVRQVVIIPSPDGCIGFGLNETYASYFGKEVVDHWFIIIDPERFIYPKPIEFDHRYYSDMLLDAPSTRPRDSELPVFLTPDMLQQMQDEFELELLPPVAYRQDAGDEKESESSREDATMGLDENDLDSETFDEDGEDVQDLIDFAKLND